jgi:hypothetical protein
VQPQPLESCYEVAAVCRAHLDWRRRAERGPRKVSLWSSLGRHAQSYLTAVSAVAVKAVLAGIRRSIGTSLTRKAPATAEAIRAMIGAMPTDLRGLRDRALLLLGFAGGIEAFGTRGAHLEDSRRRLRVCSLGSGIRRQIRRGGRFCLHPTRFLPAARRRSQGVARAIPAVRISGKMKPCVRIIVARKSEKNARTEKKLLHLNHQTRAPLGHEAASPNTTCDMSSICTSRRNYRFHCHRNLFWSVVLTTRPRQSMMSVEGIA